MLRTDHGFARAVMRGAVDFARAATGTRWLFTQRLPGSGPIDLGEYDGIIAGIGSEADAEPLSKSSTPVVNILTGFAGSDWPSVGVDDHAVGSAVAHHLIDRRHTRFAFVGLPRPFAADRLAGFRQTLDEHGLSCDDVFTMELDPRWLRETPRPAAVFAANDPVGQTVVNQCRDHGLDIPAEVAVVGVEHTLSFSQTWLNVGPGSDGEITAMVFDGGTTDVLGSLAFIGNQSSGEGSNNWTRTSLTFTPTSSTIDLRFQETTANSTATDVQLDALTLTYIPEPASLALLGLGGLMMLSRRRR